MCRYRVAAIKQAAKGGPRPGSYGWEYAAFEDLREPQQGHGGFQLRPPLGQTQTRPFCPSCVVVKSALMAVSGISSQQMNSVEVDNWFSLPIALGLPPKKSRSTKIGLFGRLDLTSKVSKVRAPRVKVGPVVRLVYLTSPRTWPVTAR